MKWKENEKRPTFKAWKLNLFLVQWKPLMRPLDRGEIRIVAQWRLVVVEKDLIKSLDPIAKFAVDEQYDEIETSL